MLLSEEIEITLSGSNIKHFENLGYSIPRIKDSSYRWTVKRGTTIKVKVKDLPPNSDVKIPVLCDYCLEEGKETVCWKQVKEYNKTLKRNFVKDCCEEHKYIKMVDSNMENYGVKSTQQIPEVREKFKNSMIENHGVMYSGQSPELLQKTRDTMEEKYGVRYTLQSKELQEKIRQTMYENGNAPRSMQQIYLNNLLNGKLNYPISIISLDIAFLEDKIYIEYNGGGHDLQVKLGNISKKDFKTKEIKRDYYLKSIGWSKITIISLKDYLPSDNKIIDMINFAKEYLNTDHSWIIFDIDNQLIESSQFKNTYDFGELRKIKKEDIE